MSFDGSSGIAIPFSENNHTTTFKVYKLDYFGLITIFCGFVLILVLCKCLWRGNKTRALKPPVSIMYYLAKTAYKPEHVQLCKALIEKEDYDVNYPQPDDQISLFHCACLSCSSELIQFMLERGADLSSVSCYGDSGFYLAVCGFLNLKTTDFKALDLLLRSGCDVNFQNRAGFTPLHLACLAGYMPLVRYLVQNGADPTIPSVASDLPSDFALSKGNEDIAKYLIKEYEME